jgi:hypothetical protein
MTSKRSNGFVDTNEWTLALPSQQQLVNDSLDAYRAAVNRHRVLSKGEQRVVAEGEKQRTVMEFEGIKARTASRQIDILHEQARASMKALAHNHLTDVEEVAGTLIEKPVREYAMYDLSSAARQQQKISEVLHQKLIDVMARDVYMPDEPEVITVEKVRPPRGLIERIFGGGDDEG